MCHFAQKIKFSITDFFSTCGQICSFLQIWSHLLRKFLMGNFIFCAVCVIFYSFDILFSLYYCLAIATWKTIYRFLNIYIHLQVNKIRCKHLYFFPYDLTIITIRIILKLWNIIQSMLLKQMCLLLITGIMFRGINGILFLSKGYIW